MQTLKLNRVAVGVFGMVVLGAAGLLGTSCAKKPAADSQPASAQAELQPAAATAPAAAPTSVEPAVLAQEAAVLGKPAPDFELKDLDGNSVKLSSFKGKVVVLEWFNPGCPFVKLSHTVGSLKGLAEKHAANGVVWLAINSGAEGLQGHGVEVNREAKAGFGMQHPVLLDETGVVGKQYGAERTPHLFVIDKEGTLVYRGGIDNSPDGEGKSPVGGELVNHVDAALTDLEAGRPVATSETDAYGCSVKYAKK